MKRKRLIAMILILSAVTVVVSSCGSKPEQVQTPSGHQGHEHTAVGDIQEKTASADILPSFLDNQQEEIRLVYQAAGKATDILQWMPCYCGCGESAGHVSNLNCFIQKENEDGSVVWDDHGTRCGVCLQIAVQSIKMTQEGKSLQEIRKAIDQAYMKGFAKPTPTPLPI